MWEIHNEKLMNFDVRYRDNFALHSASGYTTYLCRRLNLYTTC